MKVYEISSFINVCRWKQYSCFLLFFDRTFNVTRIRNKNQKDWVCIWHILIKSWKSNNKLIVHRENQGHERIIKHLSLLYSCTNLLFLISKKRKSWKSRLRTDICSESMLKRLWSFFLMYLFHRINIQIKSNKSHLWFKYLCCYESCFYQYVSAITTLDGLS